QKLKEKEALAKQDNSEAGEGLTAKEQKQLEELMELQKELASTANSTQTALGKLGTPISFDLQNAIASELGSESTEADLNEENDSNGEQSDSSSEGEGQQGDSQGKNNSAGQSGQEQGQGAGSQGQGNGTGAGGTGQGTGTGSGSSGMGQGSGAGQGQGSRDLLSVPERVGGSSETTADGGPLNEGTAVGEQKGSVPVTKGTIRPYEEVIGDYKESYLKSSERMQLPKDLQDIVQSYFSSIESE
ncbi:MAG TPA: hypothetical protein VNQ57_04305, partial [Ureibacillus sp.]|nr:hypothetical protein [Ureibacillus sp.]